ncbi:aminopeptidase [Deinococcus radiomollis]|uniref:aminopeptidase n=1 Tax=Deinococcus radiomollis TaxID=468916 RepID=UPI0038921217
MTSPNPVPAALTFEQKLANYADLLVRVGVNLQPGGKLHLNAPIEAAPLVRLIVRKAWEAGAVAVDVQYADQQLGRLMYDHAPEAALDYAPAWSTEQVMHQIDDGYVFLSIAGSDPDLLAGADQARIARRSKVAAQQSRPVSDRMMAFEINWSVGAMPVPSWAARVFPGVPLEQATAQLWDAIFAVSRADRPDPVAAWRSHTDGLARACAHLNSRRYHALHLKNAHTDLTVGLADGHLWIGGANAAQNGTEGVPNLPTDEVFTAPHRGRVEGVVRASKPLSVRGTLIEDIVMRFEGGRVTSATASQGQDVLLSLLDTDEGARHLGEIALVEYDSPVASTGLLFYNTLFDENAASHIALGQAYNYNVEGGALEPAGANTSLIHVDWMIGTPDTDVDGMYENGERESVMRGGKWKF